jgi:hypothetical protein
MPRPGPCLLAAALALLTSPPAAADDWQRLPLGRTPVRLEPLFVVTNDGQKEQLGWFDTQRTEACAFVTAADGAVRCLPTESVIVADAFLDARCTLPIATLACNAPKYVAVLETTCAAAAREHLYASGSTFVPAAVHARTGEGCVRVPNGARARYVSLGDELSPTLFASGTIRVGRSSLCLKLAM